MAGKFIVLSDIHLNLWNYGDPYERLEDQIRALDVVLQRACDERVDAVLWTGDIFHTQGHVHTEILRRLYHLLDCYRSLAPITVFLPGNHDMVFRDNSHLHALDFLRPFGHLPQARSATWAAIQLPNMPIIWPCPYTDSPDRLAYWLDPFADRDGDLLLMHQGVRGVDFQSKGFVLDEGLDASMVPPSVFHCFVGHCHSLRRVSANVTVPGALQQHHFGDAGDPRGYLMVDYTDKGLFFEQIEVGCTRFTDVPYTPDLELLAKQVRSKGVGFGGFSNEFVRITDVPVSQVDEVRARTKAESGREVKITTASEVLVPMKVRKDEIGDIDSLLTRFSSENNLDAEVVDVGREILREADVGVC